MWETEEKRLTQRKRRGGLGGGVGESLSMLREAFARGRRELRMTTR